MSTGDGTGTGFATMRRRDYPSIRQFTVFMENRVGQLLEVVRRFEGSNVRIVALSIHDSFECSFVRFLLSHPEQGREILERAGLAIIESDLIGIELPEGPQPLLQVCTALLQAEVNIVQAYPLFLRPHGRPAVALMVDNIGMGLDTLAAKNFKTLNEDDLADVDWRCPERPCRSRPQLESPGILKAVPIQVICPGCHKRFQVSDKFAGQKGPCPHCKTVIAIPKPEEAVVIHAPESFGPVGTSGQAVLKPIKRRETKLSLPLMVGSGVGVVLVPLIALLVGRNVYGESSEAIPWWLLGLAAVAVAPPLVAAGYSFLRNAELEPYMGAALWTRVLICSLVYAGLWGGHLYLKMMLLEEGQVPELFHLLIIVPGLIIPGALAAMATLDLDGLSAAIHYALYLAATVFLRWCAGLNLF